MSNTRVTPILRIKKIAHFDKISPALGKAIADNLNVEWRKENFEIKEIDQDEKYSQHYIDRIDSINDGVKFLLDSYSDRFPFTENLKRYLEGIAKECKDKIEEISTHNIHLYQNTLVNYKNYIFKILQTELGFKKDELLKKLEKAEAFSIALKPKPAICTITNYFPNLQNQENNVEIAMVDKPEMPFSRETLEELSSIDITTMDGWDKPSWYLALTDYEKRFLNHFLKVAGPDIAGLNSLPSKLRLIPALSNYGTHTLITYSGNNPDSAKVHPAEKRSSHTASRDIGKRYHNAYDDIENIPEELITHVERNTKKQIDDIIAEKKSELEKLKNLLENNNLLKANQTKIVIPILYQTLVSPMISPDRELDILKQKMIGPYGINISQHSYQLIPGIEVEFELISTNHPLNEVKFLSPTTTSSNTGWFIDRLLRSIENCPNPFLSAEQKKLLKKVSDHLRACVDQGLNEAFNSHRELYISSLEQLVVGLAGGGSMGSCISGKDRKAIEIAHTDAMRSYYDIYGELPPLGPHPAFDQLFAEIFCTKHQQNLAAQNVPGSFGTKTPPKYLPKHLQKAIEQWYKDKAKVDKKYVGTKNKKILSESNIMASNNDIKTIKSREKVPKEFLNKVWSKPNKKINRNKIYFSFENENEMLAFINKANKGIDNHQKNKKETLPKSSLLQFFSKFGSHCERSELRAKTYQILFKNDDIPVKQKFFILGALLLSNDGINLQSFVYQALGFASLKAARKAFISYIKNQVTDDTKLTEIKETIRIILHNINGLSSEDNSRKLGKILDRLKNPETPKLSSELKSCF